MGLLDRFRKQEPLMPINDDKPKKISNGLETFAMNIDYSIPIQMSSYTPKGYLYGQNGMFPQELNKLFNQSPLHSATLKFKQLLTVGNGFTLDKQLTELNAIISLNQLTNQYDSLLNEIAMDYFIHSRINIEVTWNKDFTKVIKLERLAPDKVRIYKVNHKMQPTEFIYSWDWEHANKYEPKVFPAFDIYDKKNPIQIYQFQVSTPSMKLYSEPSYQSALNWVVLDSEMSQYHKSNIINSINPSLLIQYFEKPETQEERRSILYDLNASFAGARKTGRAMVTFSDSKELAPTITQMEANKLDKTFLSLTDTIQRQILYAHQVDPQLLGLKTPGSLGNDGNFEYAFNLFNTSVVQPSQRDIEHILNLFLTINQTGVKLKLNDPSILTPSVVGDTKMASDTSNPSVDSVAGPIVNDNVKNLTAKQHQQMLRIIRQYGKEQITKQAAEMLLRTSLGLSPEDISALLDDTETPN